jgi:hypothetical protein
LFNALNTYEEETVNKRFKHVPEHETLPDLNPLKPKKREREREREKRKWVVV